MRPRSPSFRPTLLIEFMDGRRARHRRSPRSRGWTYRFQEVAGERTFDGPEQLLEWFPEPACRWSAIPGSFLASSMAGAQLVAILLLGRATALARSHHIHLPRQRSRSSACARAASTSVFSYDSLDHADPPILRSYARQWRKLRRRAKPRRLGAVEMRGLRADWRSTPRTSSQVQRVLLGSAPQHHHFEHIACPRGRCPRAASTGLQLRHARPADHTVAAARIPA